MTNSVLFKAILAMDSYNRGYNASIKFGNLAGSISVDTPGTMIGNAKILTNSSLMAPGADQAIGFYGVAYDYMGETVVSYRGTEI